MRKYWRDLLYTNSEAKAQAQCKQMARVSGFSGIRVCQRREGHEGPHSYLIDDDEVECVEVCAAPLEPVSKP